MANKATTKAHVGLPAEAPIAPAAEPERASDGQAVAGEQSTLLRTSFDADSLVVVVFLLLLTPRP